MLRELKLTKKALPRFSSLKAIQTFIKNRSTHIGKLLNSDKKIELQWLLFNIECDKRGIKSKAGLFTDFTKATLND